jgi:phage tail-like protein
MARTEPLRRFRYRLEVDSIAQAGFSEVAIADTTIDAVDYREGNDPPHVRKLSGLTVYGSVTLKWGLTVGAQLGASLSGTTTYRPDRSRSSGGLNVP